MLRSCRPCWRDHPRLCGEKLPISSRYVTATGSPPPMRGKAVVAGKAAPRLGITPAYAGKRQSWQAASFACGDHPRLCGEKDQYCVASESKRGSPPPMRGKAHSWFKISFLYEDHPRLCGEKPSTTSPGKTKGGSPPPMRGKGRAAVENMPDFGITPAYAGKS